MSVSLLQQLLETAHTVSCIAPERPGAESLGLAQYAVPCRTSSTHARYMS